MATFKGITPTSQGVTLAESVEGWPGKHSKLVTGGLPYPSSTPFRFDTFNATYMATIEGVTTRKTVPGEATVIDVAVRSQKANHGAREKNEGQAPRDGQGVGFDWFERIHVDPQRMDLGNVVSNVLQELELYSAYRSDNRLWTAFTNNAGGGITITNLPSLPKTIVKQSSFIVNVEISPSGPPTINGTLDFTFDTTSVSVPITGTRIILYGYAPSGAVTEKLSWKTDIMKAANGNEQRQSVRRYPRQEIEFEAILPRDIDRNEANSFLFDWHSRVFGVPLWWDARAVTADVAISDTVINITSTDWADFRAGGLAVVIAYDADGNRTADTLEISTVSSSPSQITFTSGVANAYTAGQAVVVPVVPGVVNRTIQRSRFPAGQQKLKMSFLSLDNDTARAGTGDASAFYDWRGVPVIEDLNFMDGEIKEDFTKKITRIDGDTGEVVQTSSEDRSTPSSAKRWNPETAQKSWEIRNLLYALKGRQTSFFLPTFGNDLELAASVSAGSASIDVTNTGYSQFYKTREPFTTIMINFKADNLPTAPSPTSIGSPANYAEGQDYLLLDITAVTEISTAVERLSIKPLISLDFTADNVESIQFVIKSRFDQDTVQLLHKWTDLMGDQIDSEINVKTKGVYDD